MDIKVNFEPAQKLGGDRTEEIVKELEAKAKFKAITKSGQLPSLNEILYGSEKDMPLLKDVLNGATD